METRWSQKRAAESEGNKTEFLNLKNKERLIMDFFMVIKTDMTTWFSAATADATAAITAQYSAATTTEYTSDIDPYDNQLFSANTKEGKYQWGQVTKIREGGTPISVTVANAKTILDLF